MIVVRDTSSESCADLVTRLLSEYAPALPSARPLPPTLSLRRDLALESLALVSVMVRLGDELSADLAEMGFELAGIDTVADLVEVARTLSARLVHEWHEPGVVIAQPSRRAPTEAYSPYGEGGARRRRPRARRRARARRE